jgi:glycosidase
MAFDPNPDWRRQLLYFVMIDRFSDEVERPLRGSDDLHPLPPGAPTTVWYWNLWAVSGRNRFQGGTLNGIRSRLPYLAELGVTALWISPFCRQRAADIDTNANGDGSDDPVAYIDPAHQTRVPPDPADLQLPRDASHGYAIQDFTDVDPRFGTRKDLRDLVQAAHERGMYVIFDIMLNHSAENFTYDVPDNPMRPPYVPPDPGHPGVVVRYPFGSWLDADNHPLPHGTPPKGPDDGVWPVELQDPALYTRRGRGDYGSGDDGDASAQFRVSDYRNRDFLYDPDEVGRSPVLRVLLRIWCRWIDETGCDGVRIDTFKHIPKWAATYATKVLRRYARLKHGKNDFLVFGEVAGGDTEESAYYEDVSVRCDARLLELGERRNALRGLARGDARRAGDALTPRPTVRDGNGVERRLPPDRLIMTIDDHDGLWDGAKQRLAASGRECVLPAAAYLLFGPSIPCLYYGTEQALRGAVGAGTNLDTFGASSDTQGRQGGDRYLREAMFGPANPRRAGLAGRPRPGVGVSDPALFDPDLPGFGPAGSSGVHAFDPASRWYRGIRALAAVRAAHEVLATGPITLCTRGRLGQGGYGADISPAVVAWARVCPATGAWGVVAVDLRPADQGVVDVEVALPATVGAATTATRRVAILRTTDVPDTTPSPVTLTRRPQSGTAFLPLAGLAPGEIRVHTA